MNSLWAARGWGLGAARPYVTTGRRHMVRGQDSVRRRWVVAACCASAAPRHELLLVGLGDPVFAGVDGLQAEI